MEYLIDNFLNLKKIDKNISYPKLEKNTTIGIAIGTLIMGLVIALTLFIIIQKILKNKSKNTAGFIFEKKINGKMLNFAKENGYKYFNGGLFKYGENQYFEIDGLLATNKAIFVIEAKNYYGNLIGDFNSPELKLKINKKEIKMKNPFQQNLKHINHIYKMCGFSFPVFSLLVLPENTNANIENEESWSVIVNEDNFSNKVVEIVNETEEIINGRTLAALSEIIESSRTASLKDIKKFGKIINGGNKNNQI